VLGSEHRRKPSQGNFECSGPTRRRTFAIVGSSPLSNGMKYCSFSESRRTLWISDFLNCVRSFQVPIPRFSRNTPCHSLFRL